MTPEEIVDYLVREADAASDLAGEFSYDTELSAQYYAQYQAFSASARLVKRELCHRD